MDSSSASTPLHRTKKPSAKLNKKTKSTTTYLLTITSFLLVIIIQSLAILRTSSPQTQNTQQSSKEKPKSTDPTFYPLKDPKVPPYTNPNRTWFMSTLTGHSINGMPEHFIFPSHPPNNKILCINSHKKSYTLAAAKNTFPANTTILRGLTFVADSFYDYENPWHSLNSLSVFFSWMMDKGCPKPTRFVILKNGEVIKNVGGWIYAVLKACLGGEVVIDSLENYEVVCFEKAVVFRRGLGKMSSERRHGLFEMIRCKAWKFCNVSKRSEGEEGSQGVRISLIGREGKRSFRNESEVKLVMERECNKVVGCRLELIHLKNMTFCDQVKLMRNTDILATTHGAQLSNMMFMPKGRSVMEMFPKGWLEGAGIGQYIYQWFADWSQMNYEGSWRDTDGLDCQRSKRSPSCFLMQKDQQVGLNETYLAEWTNIVIQRIAERRGAGDLHASKDHYKACSCDG
ncbi:uncharacterized protein LOC143876460 [Tasmannia lanceolata]|uniref:uncharacterized protein LOC143876460 n=1 Tax=Tasmannia lanceolata TaxID=3420 RepID=UPI004062CBF9